MTWLKNYIFITLLCLLNVLSPVGAQNIVIKKPVNISFKKAIQPGESPDKYDSVKKIASQLFYIAMCFGALNVVKTFINNPDKAKKVLMNWFIGLLIYQIITTIVL